MLRRTVFDRYARNMNGIQGEFRHFFCLNLLFMIVFPSTAPRRYSRGTPGAVRLCPGGCWGQSVWQRRLKLLTGPRIRLRLKGHALLLNNNVNEVLVMTGFNAPASTPEIPGLLLLGIPCVPDEIILDGRAVAIGRGLIEHDHLGPSLFGISLPPARRISGDPDPHALISPCELTDRSRQYRG